MVTAVGAVAAIRSVPALALICHLICLRKIHVHNVWREMRKLPCNQVAHRNQRLIYYVKNCETTIASVALVIGDANVLPVSQFINYNIVSANAHHESFHFDANIRQILNLIGIKAARRSRRLDICNKCCLCIFWSVRSSMRSHRLVHPWSVASVIFCLIIIYYIIRTKSCTRSFCTFSPFSDDAMKNLFAEHRIRTASLTARLADTHTE